jgi:hypothetical protein
MEWKHSTLFIFLCIVVYYLDKNNFGGPLNVRILKFIFCHSKHKEKKTFFLLLCLWKNKSELTKKSMWKEFNVFFLLNSLILFSHLTLNRKKWLMWKGLQIWHRFSLFYCSSRTKRIKTIVKNIIYCIRATTWNTMHHIEF